MTSTRSSEPPVPTFGNQEVLKALMHQIPDYSGIGGVLKLLEFVDKFESYREECELSSSLELQFAMSKLTRDALIWWRQHKREFPSISDKRITTFEELKQGLLEQFTPYEYTTSIRARLCTLKQTGTVRDYNTSFNWLIQQLPNVSFEEASFDYLQA